MKIYYTTTSNLNNAKVSAKDFLMIKKQCVLI